MLYVSSRLSNSYTMGCPPVRGDNPRALASGLSYVQADKHAITILYRLHQCRPCTARVISCQSWSGGYNADCVLICRQSLRITWANRDLKFYCQGCSFIDGLIFSSVGFGAQLIGPIQLHVKRQNSSICKFFQDIAWTFFCL